jgi:hypothetical protein
MIVSKATFCLVHGAGCNVGFVWDDEGPGLYILWSDNPELIKQTIRMGDGRLDDGYFLRLSELLS